MRRAQSRSGEPASFGQTLSLVRRREGSRLKSGSYPSPTRLPALPVRGVRLAEGRGGLDRIRGGEDGARDLALLLPEVPVVTGPLLVEDGLRGPERQRGVGRDLVGELQRRL